MNMLGLVAWHLVLWLRLVRGAARSRDALCYSIMHTFRVVEYFVYAQTKNMECYMRAIY